MTFIFIYQLAVPIEVPHDFGRRQLKFHSLFTFFLPRSLRLFRWEISAIRAKERGDFTARLQSYSREMANDAFVRRKNATYRYPSL